MFRPCIIKDISESPFDACDFNMDYFEVFRNESDCNYNVYFLGTKIATVDEYADSFPIYRQIITTIAKALNAPIKVTQALLKAMEKVPEAKFSILNKDFYIVTSRYGSLPIFKDRVDNKWFYYYDGLIELKIGDYIQADCPLALQVLLGFIIEGVPVND